MHIYLHTYKYADFNLLFNDLKELFYSSKKATEEQNENKSDLKVTGIKNLMTRPSYSYK